MTEQINDRGFALKGVLEDYALYSDGRRELLQRVENLIVTTGLGLVAGLLGGLETQELDKIWIGTGLADWDTDPPAPQLSDTSLETPLVSKSITITYIDVVTGLPSVPPTPILQVSATFGYLEGNGDIREFGLFASAILFSYIIHSKIVKTDSFQLERIYKLTVSNAP